MQTLALNYGVSSDKMEDFIKASTELSNVTGRDVNETMMSLIRAQDGVIDRNMRLVPGMADLTKEQLANGDAIKIVNEKWGEYLGMKLQGTGGAIQQAKLDIEDLQKSIGAVLIPSIGNLARTMNSMWKGEGGETGLGFFEQIARWEAAAIGWDAKVNELTKLGESRLDGMKEKAKETTAEIAKLSPVGGDHPSLSKGKSNGGGGIEFGMSVSGWNEEEQKASDEQVRMAEERYDTFSRIEKKFAEEKKKRLEDALAVFEKENEQEDKVWKKTHEEHAKEDKRLQTEMAREHKTVADQISHGMESMADIGISALEKLVQGNKVSAAAILKDMLGSMGRQLVSSGSKDLIQGTAMAISSYGANPAAYALMATGAEEIAGGLAMEAGTAWAFGGGGGSVGSGVSQGVSQATSGGGPSSYQSAQGTGSTSSTSSQDKPRQVTIVVDGDIATAELGVIVNKAIGQARKEGLL
jgi:hypothetical protein